MRRIQSTVLTALFLLICQSARSQSTFGSLVGAVQDKSGAVVPGVEISATNLDTGAARTVTSGDNGQYQILNLPAGRYSLAATKQGFGAARIPEVALDARQERRTDLIIDVAAVVESVQVAATATAINTENGNISQTLDSRSVSELPANYRGSTTSPLGAIVALPQVQQDSKGQISVAGALPYSVRYSVDGTNNNQNLATNTLSANEGANYDNYPSTELLSEFKVSAVGNNAEYASAGDVTITTKSGTNALHGSAFEYFQNRALDAQVFGSLTKPGKVWNTFGGSLSGPVVIPHLYNGHNKTFFFVDYEGNRKPGTTSQITSVPSAAARSGNLNGVPGGTAIDYLTGQPFQNNQIPADRLNPVAQNLLNLYYPLPNTNLGSPNNNYRFQTPSGIDTDGYDVKIDHNFGTKSQLSGRWDWKNLNSTVAGYSAPPSATAAPLLPAETIPETNRNLTLSYNYTFTPTILNEFRFGFSRVRLNASSFPLNSPDVLTQLGITGNPFVSALNGVPSFPMFNFANGNNYAVIGHGKEYPQLNQNIQFNDNFSWIKGKHTLKFGVDFERVNFDTSSRYYGDQGGDYTFDGTFTGNSFADLLLGLPGNTYIWDIQPAIKEHAWQYALYAQDEFRVTNSLTVSFGLRYSILPNYVEASGNENAFLPTPAGTGTIVLPPSLKTVPLGYLYSNNICAGASPGWQGVPGAAFPCTPVSRAYGEGVQNTDFTGGIDPRLSLAWRPFGNKTVFRGSIGKFASTPLGGQNFTHSSSIATSVSYYNYLTSAGTPLFQWPQAIGGAALDPSIIGQAYFFGSNVNLKLPETIQWNTTIERELGANWVLRLSYIGSNSYNLIGGQDINQVHPSAQKYSIFSADPRKPYQNFARASYQDNLLFSNYQGFNPSIEHRYAGGLTLQANYTWAHSLGNAGGDAPSALTGSNGAALTDRYSLFLDRGNDPGTRRQRFLLTALYELPFGKGKRFMSNSNALVNGVFGGWQLSTITLVETGQYLTPTIDPKLSQANVGEKNRGTLVRPDCVGNPNLSDPSSAGSWWNQSVFTLTPAGAGRVGNCGVGILEGPGTVAISGGLSKRFSVGERVKVRFDATFTNLLNHPNFAAPSTVLNFNSNGTQPAAQAFGQVVAVQTSENSGNRVGQLSLRLDF
jgi:hypothetical protein